MCIPIFIPNVDPIIGAVQKDGKQSVNLYSDGIRQTYIAPKEAVDKFVVQRKEAVNKLTWSTVGLIIGTGLTVGFSSILAASKMAKSAWACGIVGVATFCASLYGFTKGMGQMKDAQNTIITASDK